MRPPPRSPGPSQQLLGRDPGGCPCGCFSDEETGTGVGGEGGAGRGSVQHPLDKIIAETRQPSLDPACRDACPCLLQILGEPKQNRKLVAEVSLRNPLTVPLLDCTFTVEGAGLTKEQKSVEV